MNANEENEMVWMPQRTFALKRGEKEDKGQSEEGGGGRENEERGEEREDVRSDHQRLSS